MYCVLYVCVYIIMGRDHLNLLRAVTYKPIIEFLINKKINNQQMIKSVANNYPCQAYSLSCVKQSFRTTLYSEQHSI